MVDDIADDDDADIDDDGKVARRFLPIFVSKDGAKAKADPDSDAATIRSAMVDVNFILVD